LVPAVPDEWELEGDIDYANEMMRLIKSKPYKETRDEFGISAVVSARMPTDFMRYIAKLKENKGMGYEVNSDVIRDALFIGLQLLLVRAKQNPDIETRARIYESINDARSIESLQSEVAVLSRALKTFINLRESKTAVQKLVSVVNAAMGCEDGWNKIMYLKLIGRDPVCKEVLKQCPKYIQSIVEEAGKREALEE